MEEFHPAIRNFEKLCYLIGPKIKALLDIKSTLKFKIGNSEDPFERRKQLQTGNPKRLHVHFILTGGVTTETMLLNFFKCKTDGGSEWRKFSTELYQKLIIASNNISQGKMDYSNTIEQQLRGYGIQVLDVQNTGIALEYRRKILSGRNHKYSSFLSKTFAGVFSSPQKKSINNIPKNNTTKNLFKNFRTDGLDIATKIFVNNTPQFTNLDTGKSNVSINSTTKKIFENPSPLEITIENAKKYVFQQKQQENIKYKEKLHNATNKAEILNKKMKDIKTKQKIVLIEQRNFPLVLSKWIVLGATNTTLRFKNVKDLEQCLINKDVLFEELKVCRSKSETNKDANFQESRAKLLNVLKSNKFRNKKGLLLAKNFPQCLAPWANIGDGTVSLILKNIESLEEVLSIIDVIEKELVVCLEKESKTLEVSKGNSNN